MTLDEFTDVFFDTLYNEFHKKQKQMNLYEWSEFIYEEMRKRGYINENRDNKDKS